MKRLFLILLFWPVLALAETEDIECNGLLLPDQWANQGGANKVASVSDGVDANYIYETTDEEKQRFDMANPTGIGADDTIDSVKIMWRGQDTGSGNNRVRTYQYVGANSNDGANQALGTSWGDYEENFALAPDGGAWTLTDLNSLQLEAHCTALGGGRAVHVTRLYARIYYILAPTGAPQAIMMQED